MNWASSFLGALGTAWLMIFFGAPDWAVVGIAVIDFHVLVLTGRERPIS
jgi:hypothetical protein